MNDPASHTNDGLVDTLATEIASLLARLLEHGEGGSIDLRSLPLSPACIAALEQCLGQGEITARLDAAGNSDIRETGFPAVWWTRHYDETGHLIAALIEVAYVPGILKADIDDIRYGARRLAARTNLAQHWRRIAE